MKKRAQRSYRPSHRPAYRPSPYVGSRKGISLRVILLSVVIVIVAVYGVLLGIVLTGMGSTVPEEGETPVAVVILGCQVKPWGPSTLLQDRLDTAFDYLADYPDVPIVVSGAQGDDEPTTEARAMADYLIAKGIAEERIWLEEQSHNTWQNLTETAELLRTHGLEPKDNILIVSNGFHLARVRMLWSRIAGEAPYTLAAPSSHTPTRLKMYIREPFALLKSFLVDR